LPEAADWRQLLDRALSSLRVIYRVVSSNCHPVSIVQNTCREVARLLANPKGLYLSYYMLAPAVVADGMVSGAAGAVYIHFIYKGREYRAIVLTPILVGAPDRLLNKVLLHELIHASGVAPEVIASELTELIARANPDFFMSGEEELECVKEQVKKTPSLLLIERDTFCSLLKTPPTLEAIANNSVEIPPMAQAAKPATARAEETTAQKPPVRDMHGVCPVCGKPVLKGEPYTTHNGKAYHWECFKKRSQPRLQ
jgi:hypothetical protein